MPRYVAFLRGINVGGNKVIRMGDLKKAFESLKYQNVKTLQAAGNILFDSSKSRNEELATTIEKKLKSAFAQGIGVIVRSLDELNALADENPFTKIKVTPETRLYVTFLSEIPKSTLKIPYSSHDGSFKIIRASTTEVISVLTLSDGTKTIDLMKILDKEFGKKITTRNWNTIQKIVQS